MPGVRNGDEKSLMPGAMTMAQKSKNQKSSSVEQLCRCWTWKAKLEVIGFWRNQLFKKFGKDQQVTSARKHPQIYLSPQMFRFIWKQDTKNLFCCGPLLWLVTKAIIHKLGNLSRGLIWSESACKLNKMCLKITMATQTSHHRIWWT